MSKGRRCVNAQNQITGKKRTEKPKVHPPMTLRGMYFIMWTYLNFKGNSISNDYVKKKSSFTLGRIQRVISSRSSIVN